MMVCDLDGQIGGYTGRQVRRQVKGQSKDGFREHK